MKRKELRSQRELFKEIPAPKEKKPRTLWPALEGIRIPVLSKDGRISLHSIFSSLPDPSDKMMKFLDYFEKVQEHVWKQESQKDKRARFIHSLPDGLSRVEAYIRAAGCRAF